MGGYADEPWALWPLPPCSWLGVSTVGRPSPPCPCSSPSGERRPPPLLATPLPPLPRRLRRRSFRDPGGGAPDGGGGGGGGTPAAPASFGTRRRSLRALRWRVGAAPADATDRGDTDVLPGDDSGAMPRAAGAVDGARRPTAAPLSTCRGVAMATPWAGVSPWAGVAPCAGVSPCAGATLCAGVAAA